MKLVKFKDLDEWQRDNPAIVSGYRPLQHSYLKCLATIPALHNESVNIWTHLVGAVVAVSALAVFLLAFDLDAAAPLELELERKGWGAPLSRVPYLLPHANQPSVTWFDAFGVSVFLASATICLGLSSMFHTFVCHSIEVAHAWNRMDYVGIVVLISGSFVSYTHYGFFCDPALRNLYIALIYSASAATIWVVVSPKARTPAFRRLRTWLFISLGLSAVGPVGHAVYRYGLEAARDNISLFWLALGGALYIIGALLYAERTPERFAPGRFDFVGSSHQIFHVLILCAAFSHFVGIVEAFRYHHLERGGRCS